MERKPTEIFMDRWMDDPSFAHQLRTDPEAALRSCGIEPEEEAVKALKDVEPGTSIEELKERISKWWLLWTGGW